MSAELKIGDRIKDNDPRMGTRILRVVAIHPVRLGPRGHHGSVSCEGVTGRVAMISRDRIFTDGKPRRTGFSRVDE